MKRDIWCLTSPGSPVPHTKILKFGDLVHRFLGRRPFIFIYFYFLIEFYFSLNGAMALAPTPWLRSRHESQQLSQEPGTSPAVHLFSIHAKRGISSATSRYEQQKTCRGLFVSQRGTAELI